MGGTARGATPATTALTRAGVAFRVLAYAHDPSAKSYGQEAAQALSLDPDRVFKTLVVTVDGQVAVAVVPVSGQLDLKRMAAALGGRRAEMADVGIAQRATGYVVGGISPLGQRRRSPTVVDESALAFPTIYVSAGRRGLDLEVAPADLVRLTDGQVSPVATAAH